MIISLGACLPAVSQSPQTKPPTLAGYRHGYRHWVRVTSEPHRVGANLAMLCRGLYPVEKAMLKSPHKDRWVSVYVNPAAKQAMLDTVHPMFPHGSIIVKEKCLTPGGPPELLTVMRKRQAGYNPASGDWDYFVYNGTGTRATDRGRLRSCQSCHATGGKAMTFRAPTSTMGRGGEVLPEWQASRKKPADDSP